MKITFQLTFFLFLIVVGTAHAEPLWRVDNPLDAKVMPSYSGDKSPFPQNAAPVEPVVEKPVRDMQPRLTSREMKAAELLGEIRSLMNQEDVFDPDVDDLDVKGYINSSQGKKVLIDNRWLSIGDRIRVSMTASLGLFQMVQELENLDQNLAQVIRGKLNARVSSTGELFLEIVDISNGEVNLKDDYGQTHVINFQTHSW